ncbi:hypothetical protein RN001_014425 [Aquatica leii]|uniref:Alpha-1,3/1,6-mannosyltransferase ALG2 n=1 Tax=Aquatica leii TaxID=1421715 RepID=A0AAN7NZJ9_9COLE|nr:hypothetical protein RN001_014425 [Aquatica leii]
MIEDYSRNSFFTHHDVNYHVVLLHQKFQKKPEDNYIIDVALALKEFHQVTIYTTRFDEKETFESALPLRDCVKQAGSWIPNSLCGLFKKLFAVYKSMWLSLQLLIKPPEPRPTIVILDTSTIVLYFLHCFTNYKLFYIHHFPHLRCVDSYYNNMVVIPDLITIKTIGYADEIILQTKPLQEVFERSFPKVKNVNVLTPSYGTGSWNDKTIDVRRIVPDLPITHKLFVAFGDFKKRSNFMLILDALEEVIGFATKSIKEEIHVIFAGNYTSDCFTYYDQLIQKSKSKPFASHVSFLKQLPTVHKKTLIEASTAVIHMVNYDLYPGPIIAAMSLAKPIIAVRNGFAETVLTHRISAIFVDPEPRKLAAVMYKIVNVATLQSFLGNMAEGLYINEYSYKIFCDKINGLCVKHVT